MVLQRLSVPKLLDWMAFDDIDPIGDQRADISRAIVAQTVAACAGVESPKVTDFLPFPDPEPERPKRSAKDMFAGLIGIAKRLGGKIETVKRG